VGSDQMTFAVVQTTNPVRVASNEEAYRVRTSGVFRVFLETPERARQAVHERAQMHAACRIDEMKSRGRSEGDVAVLHGRVVRSEKAGAHRRHVNDAEPAKREPGTGDHARLGRMRGSAT